MSRTDILLRIFTSACMAITFFATLYIIWMVGPTLETRYWPVVSKLEILTIEPAPGGKTKIRAAFRKLRGCDYLGIAWYVGDRPNSFERVSVELLREPSDTSSPNRPLGYQVSGPWIVGISPQELKENSFSQLQHRCHAFWVTTTEFHP